MAFAVNGFMVYLSIESSPDLVTPDYYQKGIEYDHISQMFKAGENKFLQLKVQNIGSIINLNLFSDRGISLAGYSEKSYLEFYRPSAKSMDLKAPLIASLHSTDTLVAKVSQLEKGKWKITAHLISENETLLKEFDFFL